MKDESALRAVSLTAGMGRGGPPLMPEVIKLSTSDFEMWSRCDRRYMYRKIRGLQERAVGENLQWGSLAHLALQEYYRSLKSNAREDAALHNAQLVVERTKVIENKFHGNTTLTLDAERREQLFDSIMYYYDRIACADDWDEIVAVEDPIYVQVGMEGTPMMEVRSTLDLLVRKKGQLMFVDHKTTGDVQKNIQYLAMDYQLRSYALAVRAFYNESPVVACYNMIARDVPPGYRHNPLYTKGGRARSAATLSSMQDPTRYLHREFLSYNDEQLRAFEQQMVRDGLVIRAEMVSGTWPRRIVKMGGMACDMCPYFAICSAEFDSGVDMPEENAAIRMQFIKDPNVRRGHLTGLPSNPFTA